MNINDIINKLKNKNIKYDTLEFHAKLHEILCDATKEYLNNKPDLYKLVFDDYCIDELMVTNKEELFNEKCKLHGECAYLLDVIIEIIGYLDNKNINVNELLNNRLKME